MKTQIEWIKWAGCMALAASLGWAGLQAEQREFKSTEGTSITAELLYVDGAEAMLRRSDGRTFNVPVNRFSVEDQVYIKQWMEENKGMVPPHLRDKKPRLFLDVTSGKTNRKGDQISGYVDERKQDLAFAITLENQDSVYPIPKAIVTLWIIGESPESRDNAVVHKQVFRDVALPFSIRKTLEAQPFQLWYDDEGAMYGFKYDGYFVIVQDPDGKILAEATIPSSAAKYLEEIQQLEAGDVFNSRYKKFETTTLSDSVKMR